MGLVTLQQLSRHFGRHRALDAVDLELHEGEVLGLLGPNGAGKSTCLRLISGTLAATRGRVLIDGIDLARQPLQAKRRIGYLPEQPPLYPELTVDEYLRYCARLREMPADAVATAVARARARCGLGDVGDRLIAHLSDGYRQRVGLAQAIVHSPPVLILDEPTSRLDPNQIREVRELLRTLGSEHAVILSTHILAEVQALCDRVAILHRGRLRLDQPLAALDDAPSGRLQVAFDRAPAVDALRALPGIAGVEPLGEDRFRLLLAEGAAASGIAAQVAGRGWPLAELTPERSSLEARFAELTSGEAAP